MRPRTPPARRRGLRLAVPAIAAAAALLLAGCTGEGDGLPGQYQQGSGSGGYVSADGRVVKPAPAERGDPVDFAGVLDTGEPVSSDQTRGRVVVLNFWYAACPPCREEAPDLESIRAEFQDAEVVMLGVNVRDTADVSLRFASDFGVGYPSIVDVGDNAVQLAFAGGGLPPNSVPTTLVLDRDGRVAARLSGLIDGPGIVSGIVDELLAETGGR